MQLTVKSLVFFVFAPVWESSQQRKYVAGGRDFHEAKNVLALGQLSPEDLPELKRRAANYMKSSYWESAGYPAWGFFRNIERYADKVKAARPQLSEAYLCECGQAVALKDQLEHEKKCSVYLALMERK